MGAIFAGTARAAYELALDYARERRQGGVPIAAHQSVAYRLFHMYRKVEAARALARRAMLYNFTQPVPALQAAMASKITGTQAAFEVASDALPISCGAGIRRDLGLVANVADHGQGAAARRLDLRGRGVHRPLQLGVRLGRLRDQRDVGAVPRRPDRDGQADAAAAAGDEQGLALERHRCLP